MPRGVTLGLWAYYGDSPTTVQTINAAEKLVAKSEGSFGNELSRPDARTKVNPVPVIPVSPDYTKQLEKIIELLGIKKKSS
jgi:hypothetical protein